MSDMTSRLARWYAKLAAADDPDERADIQDMIANLEAQQRSHAQSIADQASVGAAVAGDVRGDVVAPRLEPGASGNTIASVINIFHNLPQQSISNPEKILANYLTYLQHTYQSISLRGIGDDVLDLPLGELYISLTLSEPPSTALFNRELLRRITGLFRSDSPDDEQALERGQVIEWADILRQHQRVVVVGAPGSGKSTLLQYTTLLLVMAMLHDQHDVLESVGLEAEHALVPLLLPLRHMTPFLRGRRSDELLGEGATLLLRCLTTMYRNESLQDLPDDFFLHLCDEGRAILLLDGLDEVTSTQDRERVSTSIRSLLRRFPRCRCVVTSRTHAYEGDSRISDMRVCAIAPMSEEQQRRFLTNWSQCVHEYRDAAFSKELRLQRAKHFTDDLWHAMNANERIGRLRDNPLMLTIIAVIYYARRDLPENRAALYDECLRVLLRGGRDKLDSSAQERARYSGSEMLLGMEARRDLLSFIAYKLHMSGRKRLATAEFDKVVVEYMERSLGSRREAAQFAVGLRNEALKHMGVLDELELGQYGFIHLTMQEYLAAYHIAGNEPLWGTLLQQYKKDWWREVILLCAGILPRDRCWTFLEKLIERQKNMTQAEYSDALSLASQALAEVERSKSSGPVRKRVCDEAMKLFSAPSASVRVTAGQVLAIVGDPRPGVCDLERIPFVRFEATQWAIGITAEEAKVLKKETSWVDDEVNSQTAQIDAFELARYPVTNAQWAIFMAACAYKLAQPCWDAAGRSWLQRDDQAIQGLQERQIRKQKDQPAFWDDLRFGSARPNHPVVGICWYEAMAFCRWLTQHLQDGYLYCLPSELEWEYAARGPERRMYAWGNTKPDGERANFHRIYNGSTAVGCFPQGHSLCGGVGIGVT